MPLRSAVIELFSKIFCQMLCAKQRPKSAPTSIKRSTRQSRCSRRRCSFCRIEYAGSVDEAARGADLVIEAVPEEMCWAQVGTGSVRVSASQS